MVSCHEMKAGQIYYCEECGIELQVVKECVDCKADDSTCKDEACDYSCCGQELKLKD